MGTKRIKRIFSSSITLWRRKDFTTNAKRSKCYTKARLPSETPKAIRFITRSILMSRTWRTPDVVEWNDKVYAALWEGGKLTIEEERFEHDWKEVDEVLGQALRVPQMAAHYRVEENKETKERTLIAFSIESQPRRFRSCRTKPRFTSGTKTAREEARGF